ncbi:MAG TPA: hypothetical protein VGJ39_01215 [Vicinamibacterales bacterium]|jgi:hypothetical protein
MAGATERPFFAQPIFGAGGRAVFSPFQFVTTGEDNLRIVSVNSQAGVTIRVSGRRFDNAANLIPFTYDHTPNTDRTTRTTDHNLGAGALVNLHVVANAGSPLVGRTFVMVQLIRGLSGATIVLGTLLAGHVTAVQGLGWPGSPIESSIAGGGVVRIITGTDPAAGAEISETVPTGARWQLLTLRATLTASATVATRHAALGFRDGATQFYLSPQANGQLASQVFAYDWAAGVPGDSAFGGLYNLGAIGFPLQLLAGQVIETSTSALQVGDNWNAPVYTVREWLEGS